MKKEDIFLRDPFVLVQGDKYYLYGTRSETAFVGEAYGFDVYTSTDLENWDGPFEVFHRPENFFSKKATGRRRYISITGSFICLPPLPTPGAGLARRCFQPTARWPDGSVCPVVRWICHPQDGPLP